MEMGVRLNYQTMRSLYVLSKVIGAHKSEAIRTAVVLMYVLIVYFHYGWSVWLKSAILRND